MLLDRCLGRLLRGGHPTELRGFLLLHQALSPDLDEVAGRARDYARLLVDAHSTVAVPAQRALRRLDDAGRLDLGMLLAASRAVLFRPEKKLVGAQLSWLDAAARRQRDRAGEVLCAVAVAFGQEAPDLQARALSLTLRHARHADQAARAELLRAAAGLPADLRERAATALGGQLPDPPAAAPRAVDGPASASWPALLPATPRELPPPAGHVDPAELVARLEQAAAEGWQPWEYDLQQALLRLPREPDAAAADRARRLATPAGRRLADWLATGGMPDPKVTRMVYTIRRRRYWPPSSSRPAREELVRVLATVAPQPKATRLLGLTARHGVAARRLLPQHPPLAPLLCDLAAPQRWEYGHAGWLLCWPAVLPSHRDVIAAHLQPQLAHLPHGARGDGQVLPLLAEADGPVGPGLTLALAHGLGARDQTDRAATVDAALILAGRRQLDGSALGSELGALTALGALPLNGVTPALRDIARSGASALVWAIVAAALPPMLPPAVQRPPRRLPDLVALGTEVAGAADGHAAIPGLTAVTGRRGSSRLVAESRRLERVLARSG
ncbi:MAG TPA: hypothetical protein VG276_12060 [Actinomycetes bacterium]|nr:hypothetical protein [Actinomycetes bacterium]